MADYTVTYNMLELGSGRKFKVRGTATTAAAALAEANAKLALTDGTVQSNSSSGPLASGAGTANAGTQFTDAILILSKTGESDRAIRVDNIDTGYFDGDGRIVITETDIVAFGSAYRDGSGTGGYFVSSGYAVA